MARKLFWRRRAAILYYHDPKPEVMDAHLSYLKKTAKLVSLPELLESFPEGPVAAITIDDGAIGNLALRDVFQKHGVRPTLFICTGISSVGAGFWWKSVGAAEERERLKRLSNSERKSALREIGFEETRVATPRQALSVDEVRSTLSWADLGGHTRFHPILPQCDDDDCRHEISASKSELAHDLGFEFTMFAYPNGSYGDREAQFVKNAGYRFARTCDAGWNSPQTDRHLIEGH